MKLFRVSSEDTPEDSLRAFLQAWVKEDWADLNSRIQPSWRRAFDSDTKMETGLIEFMIHPGQTEALSEVMVEVHTTLVERVGDELASRRRDAVWRVIRERYNGSPDPDGRWGVNPFSGMRSM